MIRVSDDEFAPQRRKELRRLKSGIDMQLRRLVTQCTAMLLGGVLRRQVMPAMGT